MDMKTEMDHLGEAIILTGKAAGAAARAAEAAGRGDVDKALRETEAAEELDLEADFELGLMEDE